MIAQCIEIVLRRIKRISRNVKANLSSYINRFSSYSFRVVSGWNEKYEFLVFPNIFKDFSDKEELYKYSFIGKNGDQPRAFKICQNDSKEYQSLINLYNKQSRFTIVGILIYIKTLSLLSYLNIIPQQMLTNKQTLRRY